MLALTAEQKAPPDPVADWLWDQAIYLADEYYARVYQPQQRLWMSSECPWCIRLREMGRPDLPCPMCLHLAQLEADDEGPHLTPAEPIYQPDHRRTAEVRVIVSFPVGTTLREVGRQHGTGADRGRWEARLVMGSPATNDPKARAAFAEELGRRVQSELKERPFVLEPA